MGEKWISIELVEDETLRCHSCYGSMHKEKAHLYLNVNDEIEEVMCDICWKVKEIIK